MEFAVGDKVTIQSRPGGLWHGIRGQVSRIEPGSTLFPYEVTLLEDTAKGNFKAGDVVDAWREEELTLTSDIVQRDLEKAKALLEAHGFAYRVYGRSDVDTMLDLYAQDENEPLDTRTFREEIVDHVMKGDDWGDLAKKGYDDESTLWGIIEGTRHDHPEWFIG